jgi:hypothetical protein
MPLGDHPRGQLCCGRAPAPACTAASPPQCPRCTSRPAKRCNLSALFSSARPTRTIVWSLPSLRFPSQICTGFPPPLTMPLLNPAQILPCPPSPFFFSEIYSAARLARRAHTATTTRIWLSWVSWSKESSHFSRVVCWCTDETSMGDCVLCKFPFYVWLGTTNCDFCRVGSRCT